MNEKTCSNCARSYEVSQGIGGIAYVCCKSDEKEWREPYETCKDWEQAQRAAIFDPDQDYCKDCPCDDYVFSGWKDGRVYLVCSHELACSRMWQWEFDRVMEDLREEGFDV